jgi:hypothetical protein
MRRLYCRADHFDLPNYKDYVRAFGWAEIACRLVCKMNIWQNKEERLFVRIYTNQKWLAINSYEIISHKIPDGRKPPPRQLLKDEWVPEVLRDLYVQHVADWIEDESPLLGSDHYT